MKTREIQAVVRLRLYPNEEQELKMIEFCGACRWIYNWGLERWQQRQKDGQKCAAFDLIRELVFLKKMDATDWLNKPPAKSLNLVLLDLEQAFKRFYKKVSAYPQMKKRRRRLSISFPQNVSVESNGRILIPKIGSVKTDKHQLPTKQIKTTTLVKEGDGWYVCIRCSKEVQERPRSPTKVGLDLGVKNFVTVSSDLRWYQLTHHPKIEAQIKRINILTSKASRKLIKDKVQSKNRAKAYVKLAKAYARLTNMRRDHLHKLSSALVKRYGTIVVENLKIKNMSKSASGTLEQPGTNVAQKRGLNRVIRQQAWGIFLLLLEYKCNWYGRTFIKVDPKNTSRTCPSCNHIAKENRESQAVFKCVACGHTAHADHVGALNVLRRGLSSTVSA